MKAFPPHSESADRKVTAQGASGLLVLALVLLAGVLVFHALWPPGAMLMTTDDNLGHMRILERMLENSKIHLWEGETLWGLPTMSMVTPRNFVVLALGAKAYMNLFHGLCLALAAWLLALYLRDKGLRPVACVFGGLVAFWVGTNLTLTYAGHVGKYAVMVFLSLAVFALGRWGKTGRMAWSVVAGAAAGTMFLEQGDVALFCALLLIPLGLFEAARAAGGWQIGVLAKKSWAPALIAAALAGSAAIVARGAGVEEVPGGEDPAGHWSYITQWSQPPEESLEFVAPGWMGWKSFDEDGPYRGKLGRSDGWTPQMGPNGMNHRGETVYVGAIPLLFALVGLVAAFRRRREQGSESPAVFLWGGLCLVALLLAFGKFFVLYKPLSLLPGFSSIRNPNKFIHFFQMAWGVLAAYGLDAALDAESPISRKWRWGALIGAGLFLISGIALWVDQGAAGVARMANWWGDQMGMPSQARAVPQYWDILVKIARPTVWNKAFAVTYAGLALALGAGILWLLACGKHSPKGRNLAKTSGNPGKKNGSGTGGTTSVSSGKFLQASWAAWIPALVVLFDAAVILAPHFILRMPPGLVAENALVRYLKSEVGHNRTAMAGQSQHYNSWLTYLFPYHGIPTIEVTQLPRPPADYQAFWNAVDAKISPRDPNYWQLAAAAKTRLWQLTAVSYVMAPGEVATAILENPLAAAQLERVWAYQPFNDGRGGVGTRSVPINTDAPEVVLKMKPIPPRVAAVRSWRVVEDAEALKTLADPTFVPFSSVLLAPGSVAPAPPSGDPGPPPKVEITRLIPGRYEFTVDNPGPVVVRVAEKYDPNWKATVNGRPAPVLRVDYMFQGLALDEPGTYQIAMWYAPSSLPHAVQAAGLLAGVLAGIWLAVPRRRPGEAAA